MKRFLILILTLLPIAAFALTHEQKAAEIGRLRQKLQATHTVKDSLALLYDIYDLSSRNEVNAVSKEMYDFATRHRIDSVKYDIARQAAAILRNVPDFDKVQTALEKEPRSRERDETILFVKMKRISNKAKYDPEAQKQKDMAQIIARGEAGGKRTEADKFLDLFTLVEYMRNVPRSPMLRQYLEELIDMLEKKPFALYAIYNIAYAEAANIYSDAGDFQKAREAEERLLAVIDGLETKYKRLGRNYRSYDLSRYVCYRRMLRNSETLRPGEAQQINARIEQITQRDIDVKNDVEYNPMYHAYYYFAIGDYNRAIPYLKAQLEKEKSDAVKARIYAKLQKAAAETGDTKTLVAALTAYNNLLIEYSATEAVERYKQLQVRYDVENLKHANSRLEIERRDQEIASTRRMMSMVIVGWVLLAVALVVLLYFWGKFRSNQGKLSLLVDRFARERDHIRDTHYKDLSAFHRPSFASEKGKKEEKIPVRSTPRPNAASSVAMVDYILNDIAYVSSLGRGERIRHVASVSVDAVMRKVSAVCYSRLNEGVKMEVKYPESDAVMTHVDGECLEYVLRHILCNSAKYTEKGEVTFSADIDAKENAVRFILTDTGIPFQAGQEELLFENFIDVDRLAETDNPGLFISRLLSFLLRCDLKSGVGVKNGAKFMLTVPIDMLVERSKPTESLEAKEV